MRIQQDQDGSDMLDDLVQVLDVFEQVPLKNGEDSGPESLLAELSGNDQFRCSPPEQSQRLPKLLLLMETELDCNSCLLSGLAGV